MSMAGTKGPQKLTHDRFEMFKDSAPPPMKKPGLLLFEKPMRLIVINDGKPTCNTETLAELSKIEKTLNVVSVVGSLRTGKSFLLNKLAKAEAGEGFKTGHTDKAVTKGIWIMCRPHPTQEDQVLALLDTEGLDDPEKVEITDDQWLFILSTLLSSTMVYNTRGPLDKTAIKKFKFLREIKTSVSVTGEKTDDSILDFFFPTFILSLRDYTLTIQDKTSDVFLEGTLILRRGQTKGIKKYNEPRQLIRRYFKKRKCFIFTQPAEQKFLSQMMNIPESDLKPEFQETLNSFRDNIFSCKPISLKSGRVINGRMLATLLLSYVTSIQDGNAPCLQKAMKTMTEVENKHAVAKATEVYDTEMKKRIAAYNTPSDEQLYKEEALVMFKKHLRTFKSAADKNSRAMCLKRLENLNIKILKKKHNRTYCHPAGYDEYMKDIEWMIKQYNKDAPYLGTKARQTLQKFLDAIEGEEGEVYEMVLQAQKGTDEKPRRQVQRLSALVGDEGVTEAQYQVKKAAEDETIEAEISRDITALQTNGKKNMAGQYLEMLKMKIEDLERVKNELSEEDPYYESLQLETDHWKKIWEKATWSPPQYKDLGLQPISESLDKSDQPTCSYQELSGTTDKKETKEEPIQEERGETIALSSKKEAEHKDKPEPCNIL